MVPKKSLDQKARKTRMKVMKRKKLSDLFAVLADQIKSGHRKSVSADEAQEIFHKLRKDLVDLKASI